MMMIHLADFLFDLVEPVFGAAERFPNRCASFLKRRIDSLA
jgi:hypothetical protein